MKQFCLYRAAGRTFATQISMVREIARSRPLTPVPGAPKHILGLSLMRGNALTIWDLNECLEIGGEARFSPFDLIFQSAEPFGVQVEEVEDIITVSETDVEPLPPLASTKMRKSCRGFLSWKGSTLLILEPDRLVQAVGGGQD